MNINSNISSNIPTANRSTSQPFQPVSFQQSANDFRRDLLNLVGKSSQLQTASISPAVSQGSLRDSIFSNISQARVTAAPVFYAAPAGAIRDQFSIQNFYTVPPENVKQILNQLQEEINNTNLSGMSNKNTYEWIESKFIDAFGEDFMMGFNLLQIVPGFDMYNNPDRVMSNYEYVEIGHAFYDLVSGRVGYEEMFSINREKLYGNKSDMEIIDDIIAKQPQRLTNRSLALITAEMRSVGINDNIGFEKYVDILFEKSGAFASKEPSWTDFEKVWNSMLDKPANVQEMAFQHSIALVLDGRNPHVLRVRDILLKLGAELGPNGLFLDPDGQAFVDLNVEFASLDSDDLFDEFHSDLEQHDEDLRESRELVEENRVSLDAREKPFEGVGHSVFTEVS